MQTNDYSFITKSTHFSKHTNLIQYEKITHSHLPTMKSLNAVPLNISDTNYSPLVRVQLFQKLGG